MKISFDSKLVQWAILLLLAFLWGSSFILMKRGLESFSNAQVAAYRMFIAFFVMLPFVFQNLKFLNKRYFWPLLATGILGNGLPAFLFTKAQTVIDSSFAGMLNSLVPLFTLASGLLLFGLRVKWFNVIGILIGLTGAIGLILTNGFDGFTGNFGYGFFVVGATICYALSVNIIKTYLHDLNSIIITSLAFLFIGPFCGIYLASTDFTEILVEREGAWLNFSYLTILGIFGTAAAVVIFNMLIKKTTPLFASSVTYLIPIVAMGWGIFDEENVTAMHVLWISVILFGVYLVNKRK